MTSDGWWPARKAPEEPDRPDAPDPPDARDGAEQGGYGAHRSPALPSAGSPKRPVRRPAPDDAERRGASTTASWRAPANALSGVVLRRVRRRRSALIARRRPGEEARARRGRNGPASAASAAGVEAPSALSPPCSSTVSVAWSYGLPPAAPFSSTTFSSTTFSSTTFFSTTRAEAAGAPLIRLEAPPEGEVAGVAAPASWPVGLAVAGARSVDGGTAIGALRVRRTWRGARAAGRGPASVARSADGAPARRCGGGRPGTGRRSHRRCCPRSCPRRRLSRRHPRP